MPISEAQKRAGLKWDRAHMMILGCKVRKEYAARVKAAAAANGTTVSTILHNALDDFLAQHPPVPDTQKTPEP